jgi:hypothetical protein
VRARGEGGGGLGTVMSDPDRDRSWKSVHASGTEARAPQVLFWVSIGSGAMSGPQAPPSHDLVSRKKGNRACDLPLLNLYVWSPPPPAPDGQPQRFFRGPRHSPIEQSPGLASTARLFCTLKEPHTLSLRSGLWLSCTLTCLRGSQSESSKVGVNL